MSGAERMKRTVAPHRAQDRGIIHILTCGSVDDGKSTLIGRLLWDASDLPDDQREMVRRAARASGHPEKLDYSLLLDGLVAEREQGITIDVAWRYLDAPKRRVVLIDSPGHDQYTRNMASGASHADAAVMLIDARHGLKQQTRRHAAILSLMGVPRVVLAVNKMDLAGWSEARFREIEADFLAAVAPLGFIEACAIPVSARHGDNVTDLSGKSPWYSGPALVGLLEAMQIRCSGDEASFRMPVQTVLRDGQDFRGLAGTVSSGIIRVGDEVAEAATGRKARVARIATMDGDLAEAGKGKAVSLVLDADLDVARGALLASPAFLPVKAQSLEARLVWLSERPFGAAHGLLLRTATDVVPIAEITIRAQIDLDTLSPKTADGCVTNDIVAASISLGRPAALDPFSRHQETGTFLLVDSLTGATLAAGTVSDARAEGDIRVDSRSSFLITHDMLARGLCADLGKSEADAREYRRRAREIARLFEAAGMAVSIEEMPPRREDQGDISVASSSSLKPGSGLATEGMRRWGSRGVLLRPRSMPRKGRERRLFGSCDPVALVLGSRRSSSKDRARARLDRGQLDEKAIRHPNKRIFGIERFGARVAGRENLPNLDAVDIMRRALPVGELALAACGVLGCEFANEAVEIERARFLHRRERTKRTVLELPCQRIRRVARAFRQEPVIGQPGILQNFRCIGDELLTRHDVRGLAWVFPGGLLTLKASAILHGYCFGGALALAVDAAAEFPHGVSAPLQVEGSVDVSRRDAQLGPALKTLHAVLRDRKVDPEKPSSALRSALPGLYQFAVCVKPVENGHA